MILLDTDITVDLLRQFPAAVAWLSTHLNDPIYLPGLVVMELLQGCANQREVTKVQHFVKPFPTLWLSPAESDFALSVFAAGRLSHNLGLIDALIGQLAISLGIPLHTFNQKHFAAMPELQTIQPYAR